MSEQKILIAQLPSKLSPSTDNSTVNSQDVPFEMDSSKTIRNGFLILIVGFGIFLLWAGFAPLDEGVPTDGQVSIETNNKVVQHLTGGIVEAIHVKEGQFVKKGDTLLTIDAATTKAKYEEIRQHYLGLRSNENRLLSEKTGKSQITFHHDLLQASDDPNIQAKMADQKRLLDAKQRLLQADVAQIQESIQAEQASITGNQQLIANKRAELQLVKEQIANLQPAVDEGYVPKVQLAELKQRAAQLSGDIAQTNANSMKSKQVIFELNSKISSRKQTEQKDVEEELSKIRLEVDGDAEKFNALKNELARTDIKAPVDGQVIGLQIQTAGAVIQPGQKILNIVPMGEQLLLDAKIPPHLIDRIAVGLPADVRFSSFAHTPQLLVEGKVVSVSTDIINDSRARSESAREYYLERIEVTDQGVKTLGKRTLKPGMPVQIVIKTGERTFLTYMLHPLLKRLSASLKEE